MIESDYGHIHHGMHNDLQIVSWNLLAIAICASNQKMFFTTSFMLGFGICRMGEGGNSKLHALRHTLVIVIVKEVFFKSKDCYATLPFQLAISCYTTSFVPRPHPPTKDWE